MKVSGFTAISRVLGFLRDILIVRYLGSGLLGDAFFSAFRFPNLFRRIFGEGAFNAAFVPMFGRRLENEGEEKAMRFASNAFSTLLVMLVVVTLLAIPFMSHIMGIVVPGFKAKVEMPLGVSEESAERESFSVPIDGSKVLYLTVPGGGMGLESPHRFENLRLVKEEPLVFPQFLGDGERGDAVSLDAYGKEFILGLDDEGAHMAFPLIDLLYQGGEGRIISGDGVAQIHLPKGHDYGWFENPSSQGT